eukprot:TRINITY_DN2629_c0_g1_i3.p1 TRINITY_DN2629_c0_g1~~TRINITY_DN2629_c0_g1_i3.p1  ORF type:complete len:892 (-),score=264.56 TRINITY_DN2629_c0_g1_i3:1887-4562(-)
MTETDGVLHISQDDLANSRSNKTPFLPARIPETVHTISFFGAGGSLQAADNMKRLHEVLKKEKRIKTIRFGRCSIADGEVDNPKLLTKLGWIVKIINDYPWIEAVDLSGNEKIKSDPHFENFINAAFRTDRLGVGGGDAKVDVKDDENAARGLKAVSFERCALGEAVAVKIAEAFIEFPGNGIQVLDLTECSVGNNTAIAFGKALALRNCPLQSLILLKNDITSEGGRAIGESLHENQNLLCIGLGGNKIGADIGPIFAEALRKNSSLLSLHLVENELGDEGATPLFKALADNNSLKILNFGMNNLSDSSITVLSDSLCNNNTLQRAYLVDNNISPEGAQSLIRMLRKNSTLQVCELAGNPCASGEVVESAKINNDLFVLDEAEQKLQKKFMKFWEGLDPATLDVLGEESDEMIDLLFLAHYASRAKALKPIKFSRLPGSQDFFHFLRVNLSDNSFAGMTIYEKLHASICGHPPLKEKMTHLMQKRALALDDPDSKEGIKDPLAFLLFATRGSGKRSIAKVIASLSEAEKIQYDEVKDYDSWLSAIPQITEDGKQKLGAFFKEKNVNNLDDLKVFNLDLVEASSLEVRLKKKLLVEVSKLQYFYSDETTRGTLVVDFTVPEMDSRVYRPSIFNKLKFNPRATIIALWNPGLNDGLFGHFLSSFKSKKIVLEDFSEADTTRSTLVIVSEAANTILRDKEETDSSIRSELNKAAKQKASLNAHQGQKDHVDFANEMKDFQSIDLRFALGPLNVEGRSFFNHLLLMKLQEEIFQESGKKKILSWDLDFAKVLSKFAHFSKISDRELAGKVREQVLMHATSTTGPFLHLELEEKAADDEKAVEAGISLRITDKGSENLQGLVAKLSPFCKQAIKSIVPEFEDKLKELLLQFVPSG